MKAEIPALLKRLEFLRRPLLIGAFTLATLLALLLLGAGVALHSIGGTIDRARGEIVSGRAAVASEEVKALSGSSLTKALARYHLFRMHEIEALQCAIETSVGAHERAVDVCTAAIRSAQSNLERAPLLFNRATAYVHLAGTVKLAGNRAIEDLQAINRIDSHIRPDALYALEKLLLLKAGKGKGKSPAQGNEGDEGQDESPMFGDDPGNGNKGGKAKEGI